MNLLAALAVGVVAAVIVARATGARFTAGRPRVSRRAARSSARAVWLAQAGSNLSPGQFAIGSALSGVVALVVVAAATGSAAVAAVPAGAVALLPRGFLARRRAERMAQLRTAWPDGLRDLVASVASGYSISQAVEHLAAHGPAPLQEAFGRFAVLRSMLGTAAALEVIREEVADPTTDRVVEVLVLAHERGGSIVRTVLEDLATATTRDVRTAEEIHTEGLEMRINARSVVVLPWLVLVLLCIRPGPFRDFYATGRGVAVLVVGGLMSTLGAFVVRRLGRIDDEPRVFGHGAETAA